MEPVVLPMFSIFGWDWFIVIDLRSWLVGFRTLNFEPFGLDYKVLEFHIPTLAIEGHKGVHEHL